MTIHLRAANMRPATFSAEARTIEAIVSTGAPVARPGYTEVLDLRGVDLARLVGAPVLDGHRRDTTRDQLGVIEAARITHEGLFVVIRFRESTPAQAVMTDVANGTLRGLSIGYTIEQTREAKDGTKRVRTATRWTPIEVSIVPVPADPGAHFRNGEVTMPTTELEVQVQTRAEMNTEIRSIAELAGLDRAWTDAQIDAEATPEAARELGFTAMAQRQSQTRTRTTAQITFDHNDPAVFASRVGEAIHARMNPAHELSAPARQYANMRLPDVVREVMKRHGQPVQGVSDAQVFTRAGSMVTGDLAGILGDSAGRSLRTAYDAAPSGLRPAARQTQYPNFKVQTKYMLGDAPALRRVLEGGEYPMGSVAESANTNTLQTFGSMIPYTRQMWINDDLNALADFSRRMGIAAREFENAQLVTALTSNPIMGDGLAVFVAGHGNLDAASAPSVTSLNAGRVRMRKQTSANGMPINAAPRYLIVPPEYETIGEQLLTTLAATAVADVNPFAKLSLLVEPRLTNATRWYLAADPANIDGLEYAYLEGAPGPQVETTVAFEVDAMMIKVRLDFGAAWIDHRGWYRNG
jgi:HK97 family phage prohead protease